MTLRVVANLQWCPQVGASAADVPDMDAITATGPLGAPTTPPAPPAPVQGFADVLAGASVPLGTSARAAPLAGPAPSAAGTDVASTARLTLGRMLHQVGATPAAAVHATPASPTPAATPAPGDGLPQRVRARGRLVVPVEGRRTSGFGPRVHPTTGRQGDHAGADVAAPTGSPVLAVAGGTVLRAGSAGGYGLLVEIDHGDGVVTRYAHLSATDVVAGQRLPAGTPVGAVGSTGVSTGPHLHLELRVDGTPVDPAGLLAAP